jgi:uroporphyrinogen-III synthase
VITSILITKDPEETGMLQDFCAVLGIALKMQSFICFEQVTTNVIHPPKVLFFGSKRAVYFYLMQAAIPKGCKIACIGTATQRHLELLGFTVDFVGQQAGKPAAVARALNSWLGERHLHIALAADSHRSMLHDLPESQYTALVVYKTLLQPVALPEIPVCLVFTSPSNVSGFLLSNTVPADAQVIAWGQTTAAFLARQNIQPNHVLAHASEEELVHWLETSAGN